MSALPLISAVQLPDGGVNPMLKAGSTSTQPLPSLPSRHGCDVIDFVYSSAAATGTSCTVRRVGEKTVPGGPAPAKMAPGSARLAFHCSCTV